MDKGCYWGFNIDDGDQFKSPFEETSSHNNSVDGQSSLSSDACPSTVNQSTDTNMQSENLSCTGKRIKLVSSIGY